MSATTSTVSTSSNPVLTVEGEHIEEEYFLTDRVGETMAQPADQRQFWEKVVNFPWAVVDLMVEFGLATGQATTKVKEALISGWNQTSSTVSAEAAIVGDRARRASVDLGESARRQAVVAGQSVSDRARRASMDIGSVASRASNAVSLQAQRASVAVSSSAKEIVDDLAYKALFIKEYIKEETSEKMDMAEHKAYEAKEKGTELAIVAKDKMWEQEQYVEGQAKRLSTAAYNKGAEIAEAAKIKGAEIVEDLKFKANFISEYAKEETSEKMDMAEQKAYEAKDKMWEQEKYLEGEAKRLSTVAYSKGAEMVEAAKEKSIEGYNAAYNKGVELATVAKDKMWEQEKYLEGEAKRLSAVVYNKGAEIVEATKEKTAEVTEAAKEKTIEVTEAAQEKGIEIVEAAKDKVADAIIITDAKPAIEITSVVTTEEVTDIKDVLPEVSAERMQMLNDIKAVHTSISSETTEQVTEIKADIPVERQQLNEEIIKASQKPSNNWAFALLPAGAETLSQ